MLTILRMELVLNELDEYVVPSSLSRTQTAQLSQAEG
jgi:hypothetical protein